MIIYNEHIESFSADSVVNGITIMSFMAKVNKLKPDDSVMDVRKTSQTLYRQYRDAASLDREQFEDMIFSIIDDLKNDEKIIDGDVREVPDIEEAENAEN